MKVKCDHRSDHCLTWKIYCDDYLPFTKLELQLKQGLGSSYFFLFSGGGFCHGKTNGNYRDPDNCYGFITCSNQIAYKMDCNSGLKYNEKIDQCDWPQNVQCGQGKVC